MTRWFNRSTEKQKRRQLRANMTRAEILLWARLRGNQLSDCRFRRQYSIGPYIVDFCSPSAKLVIELDGDSHFGDGAERRDAEREAFIRQMGFVVLRFVNEDVFRDLDAVCDAIAECVDRQRET